MKNKALLLLLLIFGTTWITNTYGQCTPGDSISCPDPENNGQVCPDSLAIGYQGQAYNQTISILPPTVTTGLVFTIHHIHLVDVGNLPQGISWVSNTEDNDFYPGTYYCVLLSGVPSDTGDFVLRIVVEVFAVYNGTIISVGEVTDSTSLMMHVEQYSGVENLFSAKNRLSFWPNPFINNVRMKFISNEGGRVEISVYTLQGVPVLRKNAFSVAGENTISIKSSGLPQGHYIVKVEGGKQTFTGIVSKSY